MNTISSFLRPLSSVKFTLFCLALMMVLVVIGTAAQVDMGAFAAQRAFFNSFVISIPVASWRIPVFPGGLTIGVLWLSSIIAALIVRIRWTAQNSGLILTHAGVALLILGQGMTQILSEESMMAVRVDETGNYSEMPREIELALVLTSEPGYDQVLSISGSALEDGKTITNPAIPFSVHIKRFFRNSKLSDTPANEASAATEGVGAQFPTVVALPPTTRDDEANNPSAYVELKEGDKSLGTWLVSTQIGTGQSFSVSGKTYEISLRLKRRYFPFSLTLKKFSHDVYQGTDIPRNFSSVVHLNYPEKNESRDALIYMNHPLRFEGLSFYQASYGQNDTLSVFQVVRNPVWLTPYISCILVTIGLLLQFLAFKRRESA